MVYPYQWGRKQSDNWDKQTNFIYKTYSFDSLLLKVKKYEKPLFNYSLNRWYNFWSAMAVENILATHQCVIPNRNSKDKLVDFTINEIPFDHKTSVFPKGFGQSFDYARNNKKELILWLYRNQSQEGRKHLNNRLFVVLYDEKENQHWKLKAEISLLKSAIDKYLKKLSHNDLVQLNFGDGLVLSDIIWIK
ncbi:MAG: hypothetical protein ISR90_02055 [Candidatus Marinimicrobia bacterium]|nr:hypothetical protein [Candidatus Neomarinimicrobiota bacterium]MBL7022826.1 hypothetical protein [Candidatus Neomarinimicrobiota bacterium]MBL7109453.1 hypothetical protein [Candidatus Neomarinimicrobiota bacterium]